MELDEFLKSSSDDEDKVVKELLDLSKNLIAKSELSQEQVVEVCKLKHIARKYKLTAINDLINDFLEGMISNKRKGREEYIKALQAVRENKENLGMFGNMRNKIQ